VYSDECDEGGEKKELKGMMKTVKIEYINV
jgi:hypothetical protein